jgi:VanZ family protein
MPRPTVSSPVVTALVAVSAFAAIGILSLVPGSVRPHTGMPGQAEHFMAYGLTSVTLCWLSQTWRARGIFVGMLCVYGGVLETLQIWIPGRHAQFVDAIASASGAIYGFLVVALIAARWSESRSL